MFISLLSQATLSLIIIIVLHYLYTFFKQNLTTPKIKDLVTKPNEEYKKIYSTIQNSKNTPNDNEKEKEKRKDELKKYMKSLSSKSEDKVELKDTTMPSTNIESYNMESSSGGNFATF